MPYLSNVLDNAVMHVAKEPIPTEHRGGSGEPAVDPAPPVDATPACDGAGWASVIASWTRTGGGPTPTLDLQVLLWDPVALEWNTADTIMSVAPGQLVVLPVGGCRFYAKIVGVTDVTGIGAWKVLVRPWDRR
jgi:hypothetical protein